MDKPTREAELWDCTGSETLCHEDRDEAIEEFLNDTPIAEWPEEIEADGYVTRPLNASLFHTKILTHLLELIDEEYLPQDAEWTKPTDEMFGAAKLFVSAVLKECTHPKPCERVCTEKVSTREWVIENYLGSLDDEEIAEFEERFPGSDNESEVSR